MRSIIRKTVTIRMPDYAQIMRLAIRHELPRVAKKLEDRARAKFGIYQPGWPKLAASTLRRKRGRKLISGSELRFRRIKRRPVAGIGPTPLVDRGRMQASLRSKATATQAHVWAGFPMNIHEQDSEVGDFRIPPNRLPKRAVLWPTMTELLPDIEEELKDRVARYFN